LGPPPLEPIAETAVEWALIIAASTTVAMVTLWFSLDVNRVFDMPKALALKVGGCGVLLLWLLYGLFGRGFAHRSLRLFAAPVFAFAAAVGLSTLFSLDPWTSLVGVYERQFGWQGILSCVGLFVAAASGFRSKRGAVVGLVVLALLGGVVSSYSVLQGAGVDPYGFFKAAHNKVYSTLGNATFAGNSLALILPISLILGIVGSLKTLGVGDVEKKSAPFIPWALGFAALIALQLVPGFWFAEAAEEARTRSFKIGVGISVISVIFAGAVGSWGLSWARLESEGGRRAADAFAAGGILASALLIVAGLYCTRTRGAWVGTAVAVTGMFALLPFMFRDQPERFQRARLAGWGTLVASTVAAGLFILVIAPDHLVSKTVKSIPYAFMPDKRVYGQGQGTRPLLWKESPLVLTNHTATLERHQRDRDDYFAKVPESQRAPDAAKKDWLPAGPRSALVWLFGCGFETYRYAFMSHKSKKLEALDPMTNHDNPHNNYLYVFATCGLLGLLAYLWLLWRLLKHAVIGFRDTERRVTDRAIAFGVLTSFFSYSVYSIAGFDSVACSVFLFYLLGTASVYFEPSVDDARRPLLVNARRQLAEWRGREAAGIQQAPVWATVVALVLIAAPAAHTIFSVNQLYRAERAYVGNGIRTFQDKIDNLQRAIAINPRESFYRVSLGGAFSEAASQYRNAALQARRQGQDDRIKGYSDKANEFKGKSERALYAALNHAWAPENVFISLFQLYYAHNDLGSGITALRRGLEHSPHLAPVRANLAVLELTHEKDFEQALADCLWTLEIAPTNLHALRTCGRANYELGHYDKAKKYLLRAKRRSPKDRTVLGYLADLNRRLAAKSATTAGG